MSMFHTWLRPPMCSGRAVPVTVPVRAERHVIRIDFLADAAEARCVDAHVRAHAAQRLGERDGSAAVQQSVRLAGALIHRHGAAEEILADLREHDPEGPHHRAGADAALSASSDRGLRQMLTGGPFERRGDPLIGLAEGDVFLAHQRVRGRGRVNARIEPDVARAGSARPASALGRMSSVCRQESMPRNSGGLMSCKSR